jgi:hypothetical protein
MSNLQVLQCIIKAQYIHLQDRVIDQVKDILSLVLLTILEIKPQALYTKLSAVEIQVTVHLDQVLEAILLQITITQAAQDIHQQLQTTTSTVHSTPQLPMSMDLHPDIKLRHLQDTQLTLLKEVRPINHLLQDIILIRCIFQTHQSTTLQVQLTMLLLT